MSYFTFNGKTSAEMGLVIEHAPEYGIPERVVDMISVRGRNGDVAIDTGAYANVQQVYHVYFDGRGDTTSFQKAARDIASWLMGSKGYMRLEDTYDPDVYRMAIINQAETMNNFMDKLGRFDVVFNCKPQRFLKSGEAEIDILNQGTPTAYEYNNQYMPSKPLFILTGNGTICQYYSAAGYPVQGFTVSNNSGKTMYVDCETMDAISGNYTSPASSLVRCSVSDYQHGGPIYMNFNVGTELWVTASSQYGTDELHFTYSATGNTSTAYQTLTNSTNGTKKLRFERDSYGNKLTWSRTDNTSYDVTLYLANYVNRNADIARTTDSYVAEETFPVLGHGAGWIVRSDFTAAKMVPRWWML